ncbi:MAG: cyclic nucleotide-binding domain-containing protein [Spirochaetaceae bacterium]|nr:cyclic nucleotide-binding domain-containing protein [Spirochaetaceae bacterium]
MPKPVFYRANAIIYFQGDKADGIPILKEGKVELNYEDLETGADIREPIRTGEFFGVKAALGRNPHDETATAVTDCTVIHFSISEFEKFVSGNPRILMKMLQVFSTQLRRIHHQVQSLLSSDRIGTSQEAGVFAVGEYYLKEKQFPQASQAFKRYLNHWPKGIYAPQATLKTGEADAAQVDALEELEDNPGPVADYTSMTFTEINNYYKLGRYKDAMKGFLSLVKDQREPEHLAYVDFRIGCCLYYMDMFNDATKQLASVIRKYPKHPYLGEAIYYMGLSHEQMGDDQKALGFLKKAGQLVPEGGSLYRQVLKKIRDLGGPAL